MGHSLPRLRDPTGAATPSEPMSVRARSVYPRWWERARAVVGLAGLTVVFALLVALALGIVVGGGALLLEYAITR